MSIIFFTFFNNIKNGIDGYLHQYSIDFFHKKPSISFSLESEKKFDLTKINEKLERHLNQHLNSANRCKNTSLDNYVGSMTLEKLIKNI